VRGPSYYDPRRHADRALARRNLVLRVLGERGVVSEADATRAAARPLGVAKPGQKSAVFFPAFLDLVRRQLRTDYKEDALTESGLVVFTTLEPLLQEKAEAALASELIRQDAAPRKVSHGLEGVMVVTTPQTGEVVAIVGGRRASFDGFNRALDARRPIGSLAKPLVYLSALETGRYTPATIVHDEPVTVKLPNGQTWKPANYDRQVRGDMPAVRALTQSLNLPTVNLGLEVGLPRVARSFVQLGLDEEPEAYPSMLLGATNLSPYNVAQMYNTLANGGFRSPLRAVRAVLSESGKQLKSPQLEIAEAAAPGTVYTLDRMLIEVMERGTGRAARRTLPAGLVVAGKTGTSNDYRDSWFAGFSGSHLAVVWMGHDDNSETGLTGTTGALAAWSKFMATITTTSFDPLMPEGLDDRWIDYYTGLETSPFCDEDAVNLPFRYGAVLPASQECPPGTVGAPGATTPEPDASGQIPP
jgi:penicillin-binding protein 1B